MSQSVFQHCFGGDDPAATPSIPASQPQTPGMNTDPRDALRRAYLAQMLSTAGRQQQTPVSLGANLLAEALLLHRLQSPAAAASAIPPPQPSASVDGMGAPQNSI